MEPVEHVRDRVQCPTYLQKRSKRGGRIFSLIFKWEIRTVCRAFLQFSLLFLCSFGALCVLCLSQDIFFSSKKSVLCTLRRVLAVPGERGAGCGGALSARAELQIPVLAAVSRGVCRARMPEPLQTALLKGMSWAHF